VEHLLEDIQSLNERALAGELEITAISAHAYPFVVSKYWVMRTGVSMGDGYGPLVVTVEPATLASLRGARIAVPGMMTTAILALKLFLPEFRPLPVRFDEIPEAVRAGKADAGILIHEGQLTYEADGLVKVADLGVLWKERTGLPLPLGLDVVRRDLGPDLATACSTALRRSIEYARAHADAAMAYALEYGRGLSTELGERFVGMYVNDWTLDMGETGRRALVTLLDTAADAGLVPRVEDLPLF
jgi:1,4-dihydroxy-6-naphthoate synthase